MCISMLSGALKTWFSQLPDGVFDNILHIKQQYAMFAMERRLHAENIKALDGQHVPVNGQ